MGGEAGLKWPTKLRAKYRGTCSQCSKVIHPGDWIVWHTPTKIAVHVGCEELKPKPSVAEIDHGRCGLPLSKE